MNPDDASVAARMRALAQLARPTAHELRGKLGSVSMHLELLANVLSEQDEQSGRARGERHLAVVRDECGRLQRIAEAFLDLAALPGGRQRIDLAALVRSVIDAVRPLAASRRVRLELGDCAPETCELPDREASRQRLLEAILEGLAIAPAGSVVRLDLVPESRSVSLVVAGASPIHVALLSPAEPCDA
jgi:signal transduction histidine kinase